MSETSGIQLLIPQIGSRRSLQPFPDLIPGIPEASLRERVAFDLDVELERLVNEVRRVLVGVFDGFGIFASFKRVRAAVMEHDQAVFRVGLRNHPVPACKELEPTPCRRSLADLAGLAD